MPRVRRGGGGDRRGGHNSGDLFFSLSFSIYKRNPVCVEADARTHARTQAQKASCNIVFVYLRLLSVSALI